MLFTFDEAKDQISGAEFLYNMLS